MRQLAAALIVCVSTAALAAVEDDLRDGDKYFEEGEWKRAATAYDRAIGKAPGQVSAEAYGKRGQSQRLAHRVQSQLSSSRIDDIFQSGLHEFITSFLADNSTVATAIAEQYLV